MKPFLKFHFIFSLCLLFIFSACTNEDGCTNVTALNYDPAADRDDGSCLYELAIPTIYAFERSDSNSVFYNTPILRHLLISDLDLKIEALGESGATPIELNTLLNYYQGNTSNQFIQTPTYDFLPLQTTFAEIGVNGSLSGGIGNSFGAGDSIVNWLNTIEVNSQDAAKLGTPTVYTQDNGRDLRALVFTTLLGAVIYRNMVVQINASLTASNNSLVNGKNYTSRENAWDLGFGNFGAARNYSLCSDAELASETFVGKDLADESGNSDGLLDWTSEYSFDFSRLAAERDLSVPERDFTAQIFSLLLQGRTSITNKNQVEEDLFFEVAADSLNLVTEQMIAATVIHHVNATLQEMSELGTANEDFAALNREWSLMLGFAHTLQYRSTSSDTPLEDETLQMILTAIGNAPIYAAEGKDEYEAYVENLEEVKELLQGAYGFSDAELLAW